MKKVTFEWEKKCTLPVSLVCLFQGTQESSFNTRRNIALVALLTALRSWIWWPNLLSSW